MISGRSMFKNRDRFWISQIILWTLYAIVSSLGRLTYTHHEYDGPDTIIIIISAILGFVTSSLMGHYYQRLRLSQAGKILLMSVLTSVLCAFIWTFSNNFIYSMIDPMRWQDVHLSIYLVGVLNSGFILLCWSAGYFSFRYYEQAHNQRQAMSELKIQAQQAKLQMLRYQINPHFLFNTLASISALIRDGKNDSADEMLDRMSDLLRLTLESSPIDMVSLEEELETLEMYVEIEKVRFGSRLDYQFNADQASLLVLTPSLILQPLVENSIKHAISCSQKGGSITLTARVKGNRLNIRLADSGAPDSGQADHVGPSGTHLGLSNVRKRLASIYSDDHEFVINKSKNGGMTVEISLPAYTPS